MNTKKTQRKKFTFICGMKDSHQIHLRRGILSAHMIQRGTVLLIELNILPKEKLRKYLENDRFLNSKIVRMRDYCHLLSLSLLSLWTANTTHF